MLNYYVFSFNLSKYQNIRINRNIFLTEKMRKDLLTNFYEKSIHNVPNDSEMFFTGRLYCNFKD
jgi:hypothetical protein